MDDSAQKTAATLRQQEQETVSQRTGEQLQAALEEIRQSPKQAGTVELVVCRPENNRRRELDSAVLTPEDGLIGDNWKLRDSGRDRANPDMQVTIMSTRVIAAIAPDRSAWSLAGDQLFADFDLSAEHLPPGTRLRIGSAVVEVTTEPHLGCRKFSDRFGQAAVAFVNSATGKALNLRGINTRVVTSGTVATGDSISKCDLKSSDLLGFGTISALVCRDSARTGMAPAQR